MTERVRDFADLKLENNDYRVVDKYINVEYVAIDFDF